MRMAVMIQGSHSSRDGEDTQILVLVTHESFLV